MELKRIICPVGQGGFAIERIGDYTVVYDCGSVSSLYMVSNCIDRLSHETNLVDILFISHLKNRKNKNELKNFLKKYWVETPFMLMQIPHHGSQYNIGARFEKDFEARYYFVNDLDTVRFEKNPVLYNSLSSQKKLLLLSDKCTDSFVTGTVIR